MIFPIMIFKNSINKIEILELEYDIPDS